MDKTLKSAEEIKIISGSAHPLLSKSICDELALPLTKMNLGRFEDGETHVQILENIRGKSVFIVQPTCPPVNDNLMELLLIIDAAKRASAKDINVVIPYYGYARSDRKSEGRTAIGARVVANLIEMAGVDRVISMDLHADQIQGFFSVPFDHLQAWPVLINYLKSLNLENICCLAPDVGRMKLTQKFAQRLQGSMAFIDKRRISGNEVAVNTMSGDVKGKTVIISDDLISTAGTICQAIDIAYNAGAKEVIATCTHPILCGRSFDRLRKAPLKELVVCDTVPVKDIPNIKTTTLSIAPLIADAIRRIYENRSVSEMFEEKEKVSK